MVDLDGGLVLVGPDSEWFWTAFSGIVVAISLVAVFRQLRLQVGQKMRDDAAAMEARYYSERFLRYRLQVALARRDGVGVEDMPDGACRAIVSFWDEVGAFVRAKHIDRKMTAQMMGTAAVTGWHQLQPWIELQRSAFLGGAPDQPSDYEWLVPELIRAEPGLASLLEEPPPEFYDGWVANLEELIAVEVALRT